MNDNSQGIPVEAITLQQFKQAMSGQEVQGTPVGTAYPVRTDLPVLHQKPIPGQERLKHRIRVSFDFDVTCNDSPIHDATDDEQETLYSLALLQSFLVTDQEKLLHLMIDTVGNELGFNSAETFVATFLPQIHTESHKLFDKAIDGLSGDIGKHWRELRDDARDEYKEWFGYCVEEIFECFKAKFVNSHFEVIGDNA